MLSKVPAKGGYGSRKSLLKNRRLATTRQHVVPSNLQSSLSRNQPSRWKPSVSLPGESTIQRRVCCKAHTNVPTDVEYFGIDFYKALGIEASAPKPEVKAAYRRLAKKVHPDIIGEEGVVLSIVLSKVYKTLYNDKLRREYDRALSLGLITLDHAGVDEALEFKAPGCKGGYKAIIERRDAVLHHFSGKPLSSCGSGGCREVSLFVDETNCVGCGACAQWAPSTFTIGDEHGIARVGTQWADDDETVAIAKDVCPTTCIHQVPSDELPFLEYVMQKCMPRSKTHTTDMGAGTRGSTESPFNAAERLKGALAAEHQRLEQLKEYEVGSRQAWRYQYTAPGYSSARKRQSSKGSQANDSDQSWDPVYIKDTWQQVCLICSS
ncbi:hypothetical protein CYMTET_4020 [Cymbomonas tetramitiformis]|uniref:J domain-containing protein n=1 Tax=Cymbomonas tetramitiformis TaxID=36881 RepID=A0AAE0H275_9CHLO|nr:hypothetical protein CYMTET_4020 [Cymbomonas tetramitiformis]